MVRLTLHAMTGCALTFIWIVSAAAAIEGDVRERTEALISGKLDPQTFDYGAIRFAEDQSAAWEALGALDNHAQSLVPEKYKRSSRRLGLDELGCEFGAISLGLINAKLAPDANAYSAAAERARDLLDQTRRLERADIEALDSNGPIGIEKKLRILALRDEIWRTPMSQILSAQGYEKQFLANAWSVQLCAIDKQNAHELREIIKLNGWPLISTHGAQAAHDAWLVAQHSDLELQEAVLRTIKPLLAIKEVAPRHYAYLADRVALKKTGKQRFGTQMECAQGRLVLAPLETPSLLAQRRREIGLSSALHEKSMDEEAQC